MGGRVAPTCASAGSRTGVLRWPAMQRRCVARGAHVACRWLAEGLKGSPCLRRAGERHTLVNALGRTSYTPQPKVPPEGFRNPAQSAPESHALGGVLIAGRRRGTS
jgi:hypothetical protein